MVNSTHQNTSRERMCLEEDGKKERERKIKAQTCDKKRFSIVLITETKRIKVQLFYKLHLASIGYADQIIFAQQNNQRLGTGKLTKEKVFRHPLECVFQCESKYLLI